MHYAVLVWSICRGVGVKLLWIYIILVIIISVNSLSGPQEKFVGDI